MDDQNYEATAHKIRMTMKGNSLGPTGRKGVMTFDYQDGLINQHEEIFTLGKNRGIVEQPTTKTYTYESPANAELKLEKIEFRGNKQELLDALANNTDGIYDRIFADLLAAEKSGPKTSNYDGVSDEDADAEAADESEEA
jgi:hypothetical protein